ncbi:putative bZIP transcription factor (Fcr3) [Aspergillus undulatus]|uniref:putative bZIP transcription factor (Fcr3) n=1 Tax=Aspergillus undulatus TaxID=1810928 RepID=UPI003CCE074B
MDQYPYYAGQHPQQHPFSLYGLPTPTQNPQGDDIQGHIDHLNYQPPFDPCFNTAQPQHFAHDQPPQSPPDSYSKRSVSSNGGGEHLGHGLYPGSIEGRDDFLANDLGLVRSDSEEKDKEGLVTPRQDKRKAQNRAAQRAFRERKERRVRDLEETVSNLQQESSILTADNERLKRELVRFETENEILRATSASTNKPPPNNSTSTDPSTDHARTHDSNEPTQTGPMVYSPTDFYSDLVPAGQSVRLHRVTYCKESGERLFDAGATWDIIQGHEAFKRGLVDVAGVTRRLKTAAQCDGQGPAFREAQIRQAIEESLVGDVDGLL